MTGESRALHTATDSHRGDYSSSSETVAVDMAAGNNHQLNDDELRELVSHKGTVRGIRNRVRSSLATIERDEKSRFFQTTEANKIVLYATSVSIIRSTFEQCRIVMRILQNHRIRYELRDVSIDRQHHKQLNERMGVEDAPVPQVFAGGVWLGDMERIRELNENGELASLLSDYPKIGKVSFHCETCGGFRYIPCSVCKGTKKSPKVHPALAQLRCMKCDKQGLIRCEECSEQQE